MKCEQCNKEHNRKRFCSNKCKDRWHNLNCDKRRARAKAFIKKIEQKERNHFERLVEKKVLDILNQEL